MSRSPKLQRLTSMAVPALLTANAMVLVLGLAVMADDTRTGARTMTYIEAPDGSLIAVDPTTPEGWKAIADAEQRGQQVVTVDENGSPADVMQQRATTTTMLPTDSLLKPVDDLLDDTESTIVDTIGQVGDTVDGVVEEVTGIIDDTAGTNVGDTVNPVVDETTDTLTTTVSTIVRETRNTATTVVQPVEDVVPDVGGTSSTPTPTQAQLPVATTLPDLGL